MPYIHIWQESLQSCKHTIFQAVPFGVLRGASKKLRPSFNGEAINGLVKISDDEKRLPKCFRTLLSLRTLESYVRSADLTFGDLSTVFLISCILSSEEWYDRLRVWFKFKYRLPIPLSSLTVSASDSVISESVANPWSASICRSSLLMDLPRMEVILCVSLVIVPSDLSRLDRNVCIRSSRFILFVSSLSRCERSLWSSWRSLPN